MSAVAMGTTSEAEEGWAPVGAPAVGATSHLWGMLILSEQIWQGSLSGEGLSHFPDPVQDTHGTQKSLLDFSFSGCFFLVCFVAASSSAQFLNVGVLQSSSCVTLPTCSPSIPTLQWLLPSLGLYLYHLLQTSPLHIPPPLCSLQTSLHLAVRRLFL